MIGKEIYRILSRKITWLALVVATAFSVYYGYLALWNEASVGDGKVYRYSEAVAYDKMITEEFAGPLTEETVRAIWEKYGQPVNFYRSNIGETNDALLQLAEKGGYNNYCNTFVAGWFAEEVEQEDGTINWELSDGLSESRYLDGSYIFGFTGKGWAVYHDQLLMALIMVSLVVIIGFCPVFSEDYAFRTADVILPAAKGRFQIWRIRTGAGFLFASVYYWLMSGIAFLQNYFLYGSEGLSVSCGLTYINYNFLEDQDPLWKAILIMHLGGWFSMLVLVLQIQAISARCKSSFGSLLWSLAVYLGPIALIEVVLDRFPPVILVRCLRRICYSMPLSFPWVYLESLLLTRRILLIFALIAAALAAVLGAVRWCRHQIRN